MTIRSTFCVTCGRIATRRRDGATLHPSLRGERFAAASPTPIQCKKCHFKKLKEASQ